MPIKDPIARRKYAREWVARRRAAFFADKVCIDCGSDEDLELDHRDPAEKEHHAIWSWSQARRDVEAAKCDVRCSSCHSERHAKERRYPCAARARPINAAAAVVLANTRTTNV